MRTIRWKRIDHVGSDQHRLSVIAMLSHMGKNDERQSQKIRLLTKDNGEREKSGGHLLKHSAVNIFNRREASDFCLDSNKGNGLSH